MADAPENNETTNQGHNSKDKGQEVSESTATSVDDSKILAALSYAWILSVIMYVIKKEDEYIQFHAKQGIVLFGLHLASMLVFFLGPLSLLIGLLAFVLMVIGAIKAYTGEKYKIPYVHQLAEKINF